MTTLRLQKLRCVESSVATLQPQGVQAHPRQHACLDVARLQSRLNSHLVSRMPAHDRHSAGLALFDVALSGTKLQKARGASRGTAFLGSPTRFPSACASGFEGWGVFLVIDANAQHQNLRSIAFQKSGVIQRRSAWTQPVSNERILGIQRKRPRSWGNCEALKRL